MNLSRDHTYLKNRRTALLPENIIEKLADKYTFHIQLIKRLNDYLTHHHMGVIKQNADLITEWILKSIRNGSGIWDMFQSDLPEDTQRFLEAAEFYFNTRRTDRFKKSLQDFLIDDQYLLEEEAFDYPFKNILNFLLHDLETIKSIYEQPKVDPRVNELQTKLPEGAELFYNDGNYQIVKVTSPQAACALGKGTKWCTSNHEIAVNYLYHAPLYIFYLKGKKHAQLFIGHNLSHTQFMDLRDRAVKLDEPIRTVLYKSGLMEKITEAMEAPNQFIVREDFLNWLGTNTHEIESLIYKFPSLAVYYAIYIKNKRFPAAEPFIMKNPADIVAYAREVIDGRWIEAEPNLFTRKVWVSEYMNMLGRISVDLLKAFSQDHKPEINKLINKEFDLNSFAKGY